MEDAFDLRSEEPFVSAVSVRNLLCEYLAPVLRKEWAVESDVRGEGES